MMQEERTNKSQKWFTAWC